MNINTEFLPVVLLSKRIILSQAWLITQLKAVLKIKLKYMEKTTAKK